MRAALAAVDPGALVRAALATTPDVVHTVRSAAAIDVVAVGKAARPMVFALPVALPGAAFRHVLGISNQPAEDVPPGLPRRSRQAKAGLQWHVTAHPVPDSRSVEAARAALAVAAAAGDRDLLLVLVSGGASAMMALPADGISLNDKRRTSQQLLDAGAEVHALNAVRKHLSGVKGGQLAAATRGSTLTLAVSDVVGNEPTAIGSGPTVADSTTFAEALDVLERYGGRSAYPAAVVQRLADGAHGAHPETPKPGDARLARSFVHVIGSARTAVEGALAVARSLGYRMHVVDEPVVGVARAAGQTLIEAAARFASAEAGGTPLCVLAAGETTVRVTGSGLGGRNQECALGMVRRLSTFGRQAIAASVGTDGVDGPTNAAGAIADTTTLSRAMTAGLDTPERHLDNNDSYRFFERLGDLILTGPTNTNVGDVQVILIG